MMEIAVRNSGVGIAGAEQNEAHGAGIGLSNVKSRLRLHFGEQAHLEMKETAPGVVEVRVRFPLEIAASDALTVLPGGDSGVLYEPEQGAPVEIPRHARAG